jgi:hypothetical protein
MPAGVIPNVGETLLLSRVLLQPLTVRLYGNNVTPGPNSVLTDFIAATFPGYVDQVLQPGMTTPAINGVGQAFARSGILSWVRGAGVGSFVVYGYLVIANETGPDLLFGAERFASPKFMNVVNDSITLQLAVLLASGV